MTARPEIVEVLTDMHPDHGPFVHADGRPFSDEERALVMAAGKEELEEAARIDGEAASAEASAADWRRLRELIGRHAPSRTATLGDVLPLMSAAERAEVQEITARLSSAN